MLLHQPEKASELYPDDWERCYDAPRLRSHLPVHRSLAAARLAELVEDNREIHHVSRETQRLRDLVRIQEQEILRLDKIATAARRYAHEDGDPQHALTDICIAVEELDAWYEED